MDEARRRNDTVTTPRDHDSAEPSTRGSGQNQPELVEGRAAAINPSINPAGRSSKRKALHLEADLDSDSPYESAASSRNKKRGTNRKKNSEGQFAKQPWRVATAVVRKRLDYDEKLPRWEEKLSKIMGRYEQGSQRCEWYSIDPILHC